MTTFAACEPLRYVMGTFRKVEGASGGMIDDYWCPFVTCMLSSGGDNGYILLSCPYRLSARIATAVVAGHY